MDRTTAAALTQSDGCCLRRKALRTRIEARLEGNLARLDRDLLEALAGAELAALRPRRLGDAPFAD